MVLIPGFFRCAALALLLSANVSAQAQQSAARGSAQESTDAAVFAARCFQCHNASMWSDHRQDRRGWEGVLYRMVGRGALWTEDDIRRMANYLSENFGPASKPASR